MKANKQKYRRQKYKKTPHNIFNGVLLQKRATEGTQISLSTTGTQTIGNQILLVANIFQLQITRKFDNEVD